MSRPEALPISSLYDAPEEAQLRHGLVGQPLAAVLGRV
ncbi:MAG: hypothetical protein JWO76_1418 [Nocardioides sp.]|nr:hypothetical protein [Nocardioides sp.]